MWIEKVRIWYTWQNFFSCSGFSYVDLVEDARNHKDYALKRITCHSKEEERVAAQEVELMRRFKHPNIIPLEETANLKVSKYSKTLDILSEVLIVMPYYSVSKGYLTNNLRWYRQPHI